MWGMAATGNPILFLQSLAAGFAEVRTHCVAPDAVAVLGQMAEIGEDLLRRRPVRPQKPVVEVAPDDVLAVGNAADHRLDLLVLDAYRIVGLLAAREHRQQKHLRLRLAFADHLH